MSRHINNRERRNRMLITSAVCYAAVVLYSIHLGYLLRQNNGTLTFDIVTGAIDHMFLHPFRLFPTDPKVVGIAAVYALLIPMIQYSSYLSKKNLRPNEEVDSARWNEDLKRFREKYTAQPLMGTGSPNMIFSQEIFLNMDSYATDRNNNAIVFGAPGTGKSRFLIKPNILQANCSMVVTDPSGELYESTGDFLRQEGFYVVKLDLTDMESSSRYNPFAYVKTDTDIPKLITTLITNTTPEGQQAKDPFWEKAETSLLTALSFYVWKEMEPQDRNFSMVKDLLNAAGEPCVIEGENGKKATTISTLDAIFAKLEAEAPAHIAVRYYKIYKSATAPETISSILLSCQIRLQAWNMDQIRDLTDTDEMQLSLVGDRKTALFCVIPTADTTYNFIVSMLYTQLFDTLYAHAQKQPGNHLNIPVRFLLDEFANIGKIPNFENRLSTMRKFWISCTIVLQSIGQLKAMYPKKWEAIIGDCDSLVFLGGNDQDTCGYLNKKLGKSTIRVINTQQTKGRSGSYTVSYNKQGRDLMTTTELSTMSNDDCIYMLRGEPPFYTRKFDYLKHPNYKYTADAKREVQKKVKKWKSKLTKILENMKRKMSGRSHTDKP